MHYLNKISALRIAKGWSEYRLSQMADMPQATISSWYTKGASPKVASLEKICAALGITLSQLFVQEPDQAVVLTPQQSHLLEQYILLNDRQKETLHLFLQGMLEK